jgi:hypothetical protein
MKKHLYIPLQGSACGGRLGPSCYSDELKLNKELRNFRTDSEFDISMI